MGVKISLVAHHKLLIMSLRELLNQDPDIQIVSTFMNLESLHTEILTSNPDVVLVIMDFQGSINLASEIKGLLPQIKIVMVATHSYNEYIQYVYDKDINAIITNDTSIEDLLTIIKKVHVGYRFYSVSDSLQSIQTLTKKELEILRLMTEDKTNNEISLELFISQRTVEHHVSSIIKKLEVHSRVGAVVRGIKMGLINFY